MDTCQSYKQQVVVLKAYQVDNIVPSYAADAHSPKWSDSPSDCTTATKNK